MCEKQFNRQVDKRLSLILNKFLDESNKSNVSNSETDALKCPFFFLWAFDTIEFERFRGWENRGSNQKWELFLSLHRRSDFAKCRVR